ncbi:uncharacterized protein LOC113602680 isoform X3 [Acinonyx jubatus]|uniref:Uncharacterized protein LOC113602680 isoform X3 n=1 Tax=Acinonyx jubatus TaxID=32536 RepID=A0ABM3N7S2_ACIJB|nr:uncharacterized protein LOC113602680 isoform X3 [Acinonyx jubatus]
MPVPASVSPSVKQGDEPSPQVAGGIQCDDGACRFSPRWGAVAGGPWGKGPRPRGSEPRAGWETPGGSSGGGRGDWAAPACAREPLAQCPGSPALPWDSCSGCAHTSGPGVGGGVLEADAVPAVPSRHSRLVGQLLSAQQDEGSHLSSPWRVQAGGPPPAGRAQARVTWRWRPGAVAAGRGGFRGVEKVPSGSSPRGCGHANGLTPASRHLVLQVTPDVQTTDRAPPSGREAVSGKGLLSTVGLPRGEWVSGQGLWAQAVSTLRGRPRHPPRSAQPSLSPQEASLGHPTGNRPVSLWPQPQTGAGVGAHPVTHTTARVTPGPTAHLCRRPCSGSLAEELSPCPSSPGPAVSHEGPWTEI